MLKLVGIDKTFGKGTADESVLFRDFSLSVKKGEFVSIIGSNGSGKSTLFNIIGGSDFADKGEITIGGRIVTNEKEFVRARRIGRVFQNPSAGCAGNMTIAENMAIADNKGKRFGLSAGLSKKRIAYYKDILAPLSLGLENRMNALVKTLSGGQRQILSLVTATMTDIDLLLLDEHTAALDPVNAEQTMILTDKIVREKNITTLMVTHNLRFAVEYGSRLIMMDKGKIVVDKTGEEKKNLAVADVLHVFNSISVECGN